MSLLDQYECNCVTYAKKKVYACYFLFMYGLCISFKVKKKYSQRGNQHQDVAQKTMERGVEGADKLVCP